MEVPSGDPLLLLTAEVSPVPPVFSTLSRPESPPHLLEVDLSLTLPSDLFLSSHLNKHFLQEETVFLKIIFTFNFPPLPCSLFFKVIKTLSVVV